jgi:hypothetical protein
MNRIVRLCTVLALFIGQVAGAQTSSTRPSDDGISSLYRDAVDQSLATALDQDYSGAADVIDAALRSHDLSNLEVALLSTYASLYRTAAGDPAAARRFRAVCDTHARLLASAFDCVTVDRVVAGGAAHAQTGVYEMAVRWLRTPESRGSSGRVSERLGLAPLAQTGTVAPSGPRLALVVGNGAYAGMTRLRNPERDATLVATSLRKAGFDVELVTDVDQKSLKRAIARFGERLTRAGSGTTGLFYYAGHGLQVDGANYLIPVDAAITRRADVDLEGVSAETVLRQLADAKVQTGVVVLDACRTVPTYADEARAITLGLARMDAGNGMFIAYSTAPGQVAADGAAGNSPFSEALAALMLRPGQPIEVVFRDVRRQVIQKTGGAQVPWDASSLTSDFAFVR